ncbi:MULTISPECIES: hypothetical protein [unclassified Kribbella]|uniref:hypothetical protein n=1 Tax=unclassified Kribbella TaxID=2644121 RepID=UPI0033E9C2A3
MWYVVMFSLLAILCVVVVLIRNARAHARDDAASPGRVAQTHTASGHAASSHTEEDRARRERKRRRAQSKADRRKRH